ncbi:MAG TPA: sugar phosphate isomerase/epimerase [Caldilineae bacterium]|nr:sugar phosphate isomerase/epimerase [Caldilineae bacterium]
MRWGIWTGFYSDYDLASALRRLARLGWRDVEVSSEHIERILASDAPQRHLAEVREVAAGEGMTLWQVHIWLDLDITPGDKAKAREQMNIALRWLDAAMALHIPNAVIHPGGRHRPLNDDGTYQRVMADNVRAFSALAAHIKGSPTRLCIENMLNTDQGPRYGSRLEDLWALVDAVGEPHVGFCLDTGHAHVVGIDVADAVHALGPRLWASHIADNDGSGDQHRFPYGGTIDWESVVRAYREVGYSGLWDLEVPGERCEAIAVRDMKLEYAAKLMRWMLEMDSDA